VELLGNPHFYDSEYSVVMFGETKQNRVGEPIEEEYLGKLVESKQFKRLDTCPEANEVPDWLRMFLSKEECIQVERGY
jgi:hypothetical protein